MAPLHYYMYSRSEQVRLSVNIIEKRQLADCFHPPPMNAKQASGKGH